MAYKLGIDGGWIGVTSPTDPFTIDPNLYVGEIASVYIYIYLYTPQYTP